LGVGSMGQNPITREKINMLKKPRQSFGKTDGLLNKRHKARQKGYKYTEKK